MSLEPVIRPTIENLCHLPPLMAKLGYLKWALFPQKGDPSAKPSKVPANVREYHAWGKTNSKLEMRSFADEHSYYSLFQASMDYIRDRDKLAGIGVAIHANQGIGWIDLDDFMGRNHQIYILLEPFTERTYTEYSPGGKGLHIFFQYNKPFARIRKSCIELYPGQSTFWTTLTAEPFHDYEGEGMMLDWFHPMNGQLMHSYPLLPPEEGDLLVSIAQNIALAYDPDTRTDPNAKYRPPKHVYEGERDTELFRYICHRRTMHYIEHERDYTEEQLIHIARTFNTNRCHPPLTDREVFAKVKSAVRYNICLGGNKYV